MLRLEWPRKKSQPGSRTDLGEPGQRVAGGDLEEQLHRVEDVTEVRVVAHRADRRVRVVEVNVAVELHEEDPEDKVHQEHERPDIDGLRDGEPDGVNQLTHLGRGGEDVHQPDRSEALQCLDPAPAVHVDQLGPLHVRLDG